MSWRRELREIRRERSELARRNVQLRAELTVESANVLMYAQLADQIFSLVAHLVGGRRGRHTRRR